MMWFLLLLLHSAHTAAAAGGERLMLMNGTNPCEGYIGIYYENKLGFVGDTHWSKNNEMVVCRSIQCGEPVSSSTDAVPWLIDKVWLDEVNCSGNEDHLWDCKHADWGKSYLRTGSLKKIQCSKNISLTLDGFKCAGAVQYSEDGGKTYPGYLCANNWGQEEANLLCANLGCGSQEQTTVEDWMVWKTFKESKKMEIKCSEITQGVSMWQCATGESSSCQKPASVMCSGHEVLQLVGDPSNVCSGQLQIYNNNQWSPVKSKTKTNVPCQHMHCGKSVLQEKYEDGIQLNCTDNVKVVLKGNTSRCYGEVHVEVNNQSRPVCGSAWKENNAKVVCSELKCGKVISDKNISKRMTKEPGIMDNVKCTGKESSLWHCRAKRDNSRSPCPSGTPYVVCEDSVEARLEDGPGRCAGRVEIRYEGQWQRVDEEGWTDAESETVCRQLDCGNKIIPTSQKFSQGSRKFLAKTVKCKNGAKSISDCIEDKSSKKAPEKAVGITCEGHKVVFLKGNSSCSGMVGIEERGNSYWLSGSNATWTLDVANTVCRQTHCGEASNHSYISADVTKDVWDESYNCSSDHKSLFDCSNTTKPDDHNATIATVICSRKIKVNLTEDCWGMVNVCVDDECGGVCGDTWTMTKSNMLCKSLDCGDTALESNKKANEMKVFFTSMHSTKETTDLNQCNFVRNEAFTCKPAYVVCSGSVKFRFDTSRDKCSGNIQVHYEGKWLPVCKDALKDSETRNTICGELECGKGDKEIEYFGPKIPKGYAITETRCSDGGTKPLKACIKSKESSCELAALHCSNWKKMALPTMTACSGAVLVHSEGKISAVSPKGWTKTEGDRLCEDLKCGKFKSNTTKMMAFPWTTKFSCAGTENPENIWKCEKETWSSNTAEQLNIECHDEPSVTLSKRCRGEVMINGVEVCGSHWNNDYSQLVCKEMGCSNAIADFFSGKEPSKDKEYHHVRCEHNHYNLGQCKRFKGKCNGKLVSIYCVGQVKFNTTEHCGGQIEVKYRDEWERVCPLTSSSSPHFMEMLCKELGCKAHNGSIKITNNNEPVDLETTLSCSQHNRDIKYCVSKKSCKKAKPAEIYCHGYVPKPEKPDDKTETPIVPIIVGVGLLLLLVVLFVIFRRICIGRKATNRSSRKLSRKEVEFESGDYDDVMSKENEMEVLTGGIHAEFKSENDAIMENDGRSTSSFQYDDIDEVAVALPPTSEAATAVASGDNLIPESALDESADGIVYEVDDPQADYKNIDASPGITQIEAQVHDSSETTAESDAVAPLALVQGDDDYLVPGQDR